MDFDLCARKLIKNDNKKAKIDDLFTIYSLNIIINMVK